MAHARKVGQTLPDAAGRQRGSSCESDLSRKRVAIERMPTQTESSETGADPTLQPVKAPLLIEPRDDAHRKRRLDVGEPEQLWFDSSRIHLFHNERRGIS